MIGLIRSGSISLALLAIMCSVAAGQGGAALAINVGWRYQVALPLKDTLLDVALVIDRQLLIHGSDAVPGPAGWRYNGTVDALPGDWYELYGMTRGGADGVAVLTFENSSDSIVGYLEARLDGAKEIAAIWHPSANMSAASVCTLKLAFEGANNDDGLFNAGFIPFWNSFREAVRRHDRRRVASMVRFPIGSIACFAGEWGWDEQLSRRRFLDSFDIIFDDKAIDAFARLDPLEVETFRFRSEEYSYIKGIPEGAIVYRVSYFPGSETYQSLYFAYVNGAFKLVFGNCAG
jgi:hypothetical protein